MAKLASTVPPGDWTLNWKSKRDEIDVPLKALQEVSDKVDLDKTLVGACIQFQIADGYAHYRVVKDRPLTLELIPFLDAYQIPEAHLRGIRRVDILQMVIGDRHSDQYR